MESPLETGLLFCLGGAALYLLGRLNASVADDLQSVRRFQQLKDMATLLKSEYKMVVAIQGKVCSETPINCQLSGLRGVIVEQMTEEYFLKRKKDDVWVKDCKLILSKSDQVPWHLEDDGTCRVNVVGARTQGGVFHFPKETTVFQPSPRLDFGSLQIVTLADLDNLTSCRCKKEKKNDIEILGRKQIERVLPVGTWVTIVGEAVEDATPGTVRIQNSNRGPFYVSPKTIDQLIAEDRMWAGLTACGVALIAKHCIQQFIMGT